MTDVVPTSARIRVAVSRTNNQQELRNLDHAGRIRATAEAPMNFSFRHFFYTARGLRVLLLSGVMLLCGCANELNVGKGAKSVTESESQLSAALSYS